MISVRLFYQQVSHSNKMSLQVAHACTICISQHNFAKIHEKCKNRNGYDRIHMTVQLCCLVVSPCACLVLASGYPDCMYVRRTLDLKHGVTMMIINTLST